ncbi:hypothetical protein EMIT0158MI4_60177 [Burkholderia ambifaria]
MYPHTVPHGRWVTDKKSAQTGSPDMTKALASREGLSFCHPAYRRLSRHRSCGAEPGHAPAHQPAGCA